MEKWPFSQTSRALFSTEPAGLEVGYLEMHATHATFSVETFPPEATENFQIG